MLGSNKPFKIGIIGSGRMGSGIARKLAPHQQILICDRNLLKAKKIASEIGAEALDSCVEVVSQTEMILLAVKPQDLGSVSSVIREKLSHTKLLISIVAGTSMATLKHLFGVVSILRMMPNLALLCGQGVIGLAENDQLTKETKKNVMEIFSALGNLHWMAEHKLEALTALTASGEAYAYVMIESIIEAGIAMGFDSHQAQELVLEMLTGAVTMLRESHKHPSELKWEVTSPGGTTIEGLKVLEKSGVRAGIMEAFLAAYEKTKQLAKQGHGQR